MNSFGDREVLVYGFECYDLNLDAKVVPPFKATEAAIVRRFKGTLFPLTGERVDPAELDAEGRWFRVATGWGSLG